MTRREGFNKRLESIGFSNTFNAGLWLDKFITDSRKEEKNSSSQDNKQKKPRPKLVEEVVSVVEPSIYKTYFENIWKTNLDSFGAKCQKAKVKNRLAINLGSESVLETSIALHRLFGVPYIPGSALKGLVSHFLHQYGGEKWKIGNDKNKEGDYHTIVFGNQENAGFVTFYDALYIPETGFNKRALYADVMTTHHSDYYGDKKLPPADWDNPNPVPFISATGEFLFALSGPNDWVDLTFEILSYALEYEGVGAKTSSGYGRFGELTDYQKSETASETEGISETETLPEIIGETPDTVETPPQLSDEERKTGRLQWIQQRLDEITTYDKEKFKEVVKKVKKLDEKSKKEYAQLVVKKAEIICQNETAILENAVWFIEAKSMSR